MHSSGPRSQTHRSSTQRMIARTTTTAPPPKASHLPGLARKSPPSPRNSPSRNLLLNLKQTAVIGGPEHGVISDIFGTNHSTAHDLPNAILVITHRIHLFQARLFATLSTAPLNRGFYNTPNVPVQFDKTTTSKSTSTTTSTTPSLSLNPQVIQLDYTPSYHQRSMTVSSDTLPFCHDWTKSGITIDHSDFSTDIRRLSQLDVGMGGGEGTGLAEGIM
jgi:hypothetical protein